MKPKQATSEDIHKEVPKVGEMKKRDIRFRAWDMKKEKKCIHNWRFMCVTYNNSTVSYADGYKFFCIKCLEIKWKSY